VLTPEGLTTICFDDADEDDRARLEMPDEMLDSTDAHDLLFADFVDDGAEDARDGDLSRG